MSNTESAFFVANFEMELTSENGESRNYFTKYSLRSHNIRCYCIQGRRVYLIFFKCVRNKAKTCSSYKINPLEYKSTNNCTISRASLIHPAKKRASSFTGFVKHINRKNTGVVILSTARLVCVLDRARKKHKILHMRFKWMKNCI